MFQKRLLAILLSISLLPAFGYCQNDESAIQEVLEQISGHKLSPVRTFRIKEGLTNRNYKVFIGETPVFVRLGHENPASLKIDREKERFFYSLVERDGIAPKLLYSNPANGTLVVQFITGTAYGKIRGTWLYDRKQSIHAIATLLRRAHANKAPVPPTVDYPFQIIEDYIQQARSASIPLPRTIDNVIDIVHRLQGIIPAHTKVLCHQDLVPENFIFDGQRLYLIDWEYAEWSNPYYDLASICIEHGYTNEEKELLLSCYCEHPTAQDRIHLEEMCMLYSMRDALWYFIERQQSLHRPCDFLELANLHYRNFFTSLQWLHNHGIQL